MCCIIYYTQYIGICVLHIDFPGIIRTDNFVNVWSLECKCKFTSIPMASMWYEMNQLYSTELKSMAEYKTAVAPVRWQWSYCSLALSPRYYIFFVCNFPSAESDIACIWSSIYLHEDGWFADQYVYRTIYGRYIFNRSTCTHHYCSEWPGEVFDSPSIAKLY